MDYHTGRFSRRDIDAIKRGFGDHAYKTGIALGDNYLSIRPYINGGIEMFDGVTRESLTGFEKKNRGQNKDRTPTQPSRIYFDPKCKGPHASGMPPQEFPDRMRDGLIEIAIGAGYDIMANSAGKKVHLNGNMNDRKQRRINMLKDLENAGYRGVSLGVKPVAFPLIASKEPLNYNGEPIRTFEDLKSANVEVISEIASIVKQYGKEKGMKFRSVKQAYGGADRQVAGGLFPVGSDLMERGSVVLENARFVAPIVDKNNGQSELCIITYSEPFTLVTEQAYKRERAFFDVLFAFTEDCVTLTMEEEPELFEEKYLGFIERYKSRVAQLIKDGQMSRKEAFS